jgi:hypothetical protein
LFFTCFFSSYSPDSVICAILRGLLPEDNFRVSACSLVNFFTWVFYMFCRFLYAGLVWAVLPFFLLLSGCSPTSLEDYQKRGQNLSRAFLKELQVIDSREALLLAEPRLKKYFDYFAELIIEAREFQGLSEEDGPGDDTIDQELSLEVKKQMLRIVSLEGGQEVLERAQREAMLKLDDYEKKRKRSASIRID